MDKDITFLYLGSKFVNFTVTLPSYLHRTSLRLMTIKNKIPTDVLEFMKVDVQQFMGAFYPKITWSDDDVGSLVFEAVTTSPYDNYVMIPPKQKAASELTEPAMKAWGVDMVHKPSKIVHPCCIGEHGDHEYMLPFYKNNPDLMEYYTRIMNGTDERKKDSIKSDYSLLQEIKDDPDHSKHMDTKFHCLGHPFELKDYDEEDFAARLYHSIKEKMPANIQINPSYKFARNFQSLQQIYSTSSPKFYYFRAVPDLMFTKRAAGANIAESVVYVDTDLLEIKTGGRLQYSKQSDIPKAFAQIVGGLHFIATAKAIKAFKNRTIPKEVSSNGLLVNKKDGMVFFTLKVNIADLSHAQFTVEYSVASYDSDELTLGLVCKGITETIQV